jgi:hypothetical protein
MTDTIEAIVRPFQTPDVSPSTAYFTPGKAGPVPVLLQFGRGGGGKILNGSFTFDESYYMTQYNNEKKNPSFGSDIGQPFGQGVSP